MQPLLLLKQTLEAQYDPGSLLLDGPNVRMTSAHQMMSRLNNRQTASCFSLAFHLDSEHSLKVEFKRVEGKGIELHRICYTHEGAEIDVRQGPASESVLSFIRSINDEGLSLIDMFKPKEDITWEISRDRCLFKLSMLREKYTFFQTELPQSQALQQLAKKLIHVPGLRGNPARTYRTTAFEGTFPGTFENYVASVISHWQKEQDPRLDKLASDLQKLGLTSRVTAEQVDDTQVEIKVGRVTNNSKQSRDNVSIADVGFGMSQILPVIVALHVAAKDQIVYIEQPEIHLHPKAQWILGSILGDAVLRGIQLVIETHSSLLLLGIQELVASDRLPADKVQLHWFSRNQKGETVISAADLDETGSFGDWPEDFDETTMIAQRAYLAAAERKLFEKNAQKKTTSKPGY